MSVVLSLTDEEARATMDLLNSASVTSPILASVWEKLHTKLQE